MYQARYIYDAGERLIDVVERPPLGDEMQGIALADSLHGIVTVMNQLGAPPSRIEQLPDVRADVAHFRKEYEAGAPFTPNNYGCQEPQ